MTGIGLNEGKENSLVFIFNKARLRD